MGVNSSNWRVLHHSRKAPAPVIHCPAPEARKLACLARGPRLPTRSRNKKTFPEESLTMTSRNATAKDYLAGLPDDWYLPDPPREPDMERWKSAASFNAMIEAHFAHRSDVLISGTGIPAQRPAR